ncbi:zeta toxin family protein [Fulvivirgaceae bacterium PWU5]|uniref:Zeta toxin family protein n=1 Tax=Dawidia cretensis TaxID=2782350 RepID=A0AAP2DXY9_9BACT|nr:zeta toxin family protein [Dawidia cretensis]MBT1707824.1 zeta toxin family protein [Dawidia cretensis]
MRLSILQEKQDSLPNLYIIAGCNGAGKTTASFTIFPGLLNCKEFVNADSIAAGLSPFNPEGVAVEAGRLMLSRIDELTRANVDFAIETTLATRSYLSLVKRAQSLGYKVTLLYIWLDSPQTAKERVAARVAKGGHNIPGDVIERRYYRGIFNLINLFIPVVNGWMVVNSTNVVIEPIATGDQEGKNVVRNDYFWNVIVEQSKRYGKG